MNSKHTLRLSVLAAGLSLAMLAAGQGVAWSAPTDVPAKGMNGEACEEQEGMGPGRGALEELNLSADQMDKLRKDRSENRKQMIKLMADMKTLQVDLGDELEKEKPDMGKIEKLAGQIGDQHAKMIVQRAKGISYLKSILTPEQRKKMQELEIRHSGMGMGGSMMNRWTNGKQGKGERHAEPGEPQ